MTETLKPLALPYYEPKQPSVKEMEEALPRIRLGWLRGYERINFNRPNTYLCVGQRGTGKSSLLESIGSRYPKVIDLFGSKDNEGVSWCKKSSPFKNILFIVGDSVNVVSEWNQIKVSQLKLKDFENYDLITTVHAFYTDSNDYFKSLQRITNILWEQRSFWTEPWYVLIREAANWIYSRLQIVKDSNLAKADFIQTLREARHSGLAVGLDTIRWTNIDKEVRDISDYMFLKRVGALGVPRDLRFIYRYVVPSSLMSMNASTLVLLTGRGAIAYGTFDYPLWHKEEKEDILRLLKIEVTYPSGSATGMGWNISSVEHAKIVERYLEIRSMAKVSRELHRSTATIHQHLTDHTHLVNSIGHCPECMKANSPHMKTAIERTS